MTAQYLSQSQANIAVQQAILAKNIIDSREEKPKTQQ